MKLDIIKDFVGSSSFDTMLLRVARDGDKAIPNDKNWLYKYPKEALIFSETEMVWNTVKKVYTGSKFNELLIGKVNLQEKMKFSKLYYFYPNECKEKLRCIFLTHPHYMYLQFCRHKIKV